MIRHATIEDANRIAEINISGWRNAYRGIVDDRYLFGRLSVVKTALRITKAIQENTEENYIFEENGIIKANMTIGPCRNEDMKNAFELWGIYVEPLMKRQGIGKILVEYCEKCALERGFKEVVLWVLKDNLDSRVFYEKVGFILEGKEEYLDNINAKEIRYYKKLK